MQQAVRVYRYDDPDEAHKFARRRIVNNALRRGQRSLNLSGFGLRELPPEIGQLKLLTFLDLSGNLLATLPAEIGQMSGLRFLILRRNQLSVLPHEIGALKALRTACGSPPSCSTSLACVAAAHAGNRTGAAARACLARSIPRVPEAARMSIAAFAERIERGDTPELAAALMPFENKMALWAWRRALAGRKRDGEIGAVNLAACSN